MSTFITQFVKINSVHMYEEGATLAPQYNRPAFGKTSYKGGIKPFQTFIPYQWKATFNDRMTVMVHTQLNDDVADNQPILEILDHNKNVVDPVTFGGGMYAGIQIISGNNDTDPVSGIVTPLLTSVWQFNFAHYLTPATDSGIYYLRLTNLDISGNPKTYLSDQILVYGTAASIFPNTMLIECSNDTDKNDIIMSDWGGGFRPAFAIRVEADIREDAFKGVYDGYLKEDYTQLETNIESWRAWTLNIGTVREGVPKTLLESVTKMLECDTVLIDGEYYIMDNNSGGGDSGTAVWKINDKNTKDLVYGKLPIREKYSNQDVLRSNAATAGYYTSPGVFPYAITPATMVLGARSVSFPEQVFYSSGDESAYLALLNGTFATANGLTGSFSNGGGAWAYNNGAGEGFVFTLSPTILTKFIKYSLFADGLWQYQIQGAGPGNMQVVDWGDAGSFPYNKQYYSYSTTAGLIQSHTYIGSSATIVVHHFHNDLIKGHQFVPSGGATSYMNGDMGGVFSASLTGIAISNMNFGGTQIKFPLFGSAAALQSLTIQNSNFLKFNAATDVFVLNNFSSLVNIFLANNVMTATTVDAYFNDFYTNSAFVSGGLFYTKLQTPSAPPTSASSTSRSVLAGAGWTITTD